MQPLRRGIDSTTEWDFRGESWNIKIQRSLQEYNRGYEKYHKYSRWVYENFKELFWIQRKKTGIQNEFRFIWDLQ